MSEFLTLVNEANADPFERKNMPGQIFHSNICQNQLDTCKISDFRKLQNIVVNVISLPVMTPDKFSYI